jgi:hypothetical protein
VSSNNRSTTPKVKRRKRNLKEEGGNQVTSLISASARKRGEVRERECCVEMCRLKSLVFFMNDPSCVAITSTVIDLLTRPV